MYNIPYHVMGVTDHGQSLWISSPSDTMMLSSGGVAFSSGLPSSQMSYRSSTTESESSSSESSTLRAQSGQPDCHQTHHVPFVPQMVYPIAPKAGLCVEETMGQDVPLQDEPFRLTFNTCEDEEEGEGEEGRGAEREGDTSRVEIQDLKKQWNQTQELLTAKEQERNGLRTELDQLQELNARIIEEKEGESLQHEVNKRELENALKKKIDEIESLRLHVQGLQHGPRPAPEMNPDEFYPLDKNPHGVCLIINNHRFYHDTDPAKAHPDRYGAEIDQFNLTQTFRYLRYKVEVHENLTDDQLTDAVMRMSQRDHSNYDSFICCILTHGLYDILYGANCKPVSIHYLTGLIKLCPTLRNKPKLFFIQCCRGEMEEIGVEECGMGKMPQVEIQDLKKQWNQTHKLMTVKEQERYRLRVELDQLQELNKRIIEEMEGESLQNEANKSELKNTLQKVYDSGESTFHSTIPRDANFFFGYATPPGKVAYCSRKHGSWYISELCRVFTQHGYHDSLSSMMRRVNRQVSAAFTKDGYKQCTEFVDRLQREVHFFHFIRNRSKPAEISATGTATVYILYFEPYIFGGGTGSRGEESMESAAESVTHGEAGEMAGIHPPRCGRTHTQLLQQQYVEKVHQLQMQLEHERAHNLRQQHQHQQPSNGELERELERKGHEVHDLQREVEVLRKQLLAGDDSEMYPMNIHPPHGKAIVIVSDTFTPNPDDPSIKLLPRPGAEYDMFYLKSTFEHLQYEVDCYTNLTCEEMYQVFYRAAKESHEENDSFICCISSHGDENVIYGTDSVGAKRFELIQIMKQSESLRGKPKLFFLQACRTKSSSAVGGARLMCLLPEMYLPEAAEQDADVYVANASTVNYASYRDHEHGSWFVMALHHIFTRHGDRLTLNQMMHKVNSLVCTAQGVVEDDDPGNEGTVQRKARQCAETTSSLRIGLRFRFDSQ